MAGVAWPTNLAELLQWFEDDQAIINDETYDMADPPLYIRNNVFNVSQAVPAADLLYPFEFENSFANGGFWSHWARDNLHVPFICVAVYLIVVFGLKLAMSNRDRFAVRVPWILWNFLLSGFSLWGACRMVPHLILLIQTRGLYTSYCGRSAETYGWGEASGLWTVFFIFSKVPELLDTIFIVLMKADLRCLQWYHHITVLLYTWHSYATRSGAGVWFISMNYTVHAVMYLYFALMLLSSEWKSRAYRIKDDLAKQEAAVTSATEFRASLSFFAPLITVMQISQMVVGIVVIYWIVRDSSAFAGTQQCYVRRTSVVAGGVMYFSYFVLFVVFAIQKYCCKTRSKSTEEHTKQA